MHLIIIFGDLLIYSISQHQMKSSFYLQSLFRRWLYVQMWNSLTVLFGPFVPEFANGNSNWSDIPLCFVRLRWWFHSFVCCFRFRYSLDSSLAQYWWLCSWNSLLQLNWQLDYACFTIIFQSIRLRYPAKGSNAWWFRSFCVHPQFRWWFPLTSFPGWLYYLRRYDIFDSLRPRRTLTHCDLSSNRHCTAIKEIPEWAHNQNSTPSYPATLLASSNPFHSPE